MSSYTRVAWNPKERVARAAAFMDDHFGRHRYGVMFEGDHHVYRPDEVEIPIDLVLVQAQQNQGVQQCDHLVSAEFRDSVIEQCATIAFHEAQKAGLNCVGCVERERACEEIGWAILRLRHESQSQGDRTQADLGKRGLETK